MKQPALDLYDVPPAAKRPWRRVRETSRAAYADGRERFTGRRAEVLRMLAAHFNRTQEWPTSAELCQDGDFTAAHVSRTWGDQILYTRRGLVDLQAVGVVESAGTRHCHITGGSCHIWRVVPR
jgi:hypothetical protein